LTLKTEKTEKVLVVKTERLSPYLMEKGLITDNADKILGIISQCHEFLPRPEAEEDPGYKQIIPYVSIRRGNQVYLLRRLKKGGESRLHGLLSLGVGGHINSQSDGGKDALMRGLMRELEEEVSLRGSINLRFKGLITDDTNGVGSVHLGLYYILETDGGVEVRETEKLAGEWVDISRLPQLAPEMETWSQIILEHLD
jgi:predicted NUDIX family phosphoesterase